MVFDNKILLNSRLVFPIGLFIILLLTGCGNSSSKSDTDSSAQAAIEAREGVVKSLSEAGLNTRVYPLASFQKDAIHDISVLPLYMQNSNKSITALMLGVYMSDLGYINGFGQSVETERYFDGCFLLANDIGMKKQFEKAIDFQFSDILSGKGNLSPNQEKILSGADNLVDSIEFKKRHAAALAGFYLEELYHMAVFIESSSVSDSLRIQTFQILMDQKLALNNLVRYFDHLPMKPEGIALYTDFLQLQEKYLSIHFVLFSKESFHSVLEEKPYAEILSSIKMIRVKITSL